MYKIQDVVYAKLFKEVVPATVKDGEEIPSKFKFIWKLSTEKPSDNFLIINTMRKADESRILELEGSLQIDETSSKKEQIKVGTEKSEKLISLIMEKTDFSFAKFKQEHLDIALQASLFYEWWAFSRASEEDYNLFL